MYTPDSASDEKARVNGKENPYSAIACNTGSPADILLEREANTAGCIDYEILINYTFNLIFNMVSNIHLKMLN